MTYHNYHLSNWRSGWCGRSLRGYAGQSFLLPEYFHPEDLWHEPLRNLIERDVHTFSNFQTINFLLDLINSFFPSGDLSTAKGKDTMKRHEERNLPVDLMNIARVWRVSEYSLT